MSRLDVDDAADTWRYAALSSPDATSIYDIAQPSRGGDRTAIRRRRLIRVTRQDVARLRDAIAAGWDVGLELAYEEQRLASLEST